ncbi:hypothetical protein O7626_02870 [Micromonospora sp. WMMD1102]|uniref:hypothetical protein n=1 Tax=Micromonospora sp. WMMD1102 TaxID=3016105 RepID=UPI002414F503|nr:hypothetical protein [Micromonospora sp. WMMD1102]MDG4784884.1 hypothetical protein [Micromonospora sp. WMMD1102]
MVDSADPPTPGNTHPPALVVRGVRDTGPPALVVHGARPLALVARDIRGTPSR